jgi:hypothetical protein
MTILDIGKLKGVIALCFFFSRELTFTEERDQYQAIPNSGQRTTTIDLFPIQMNNCPTKSTEEID